MNCQWVAEECSVFYSYLRFICRLPDPAMLPLAVLLLKDGVGQSTDARDAEIVSLSGGAGFRITLEALIDRSAFPADYALALVFRGGRQVIPFAKIIEAEHATHAQSLMGGFHDALRTWLAAHPGRRPAMIDIGGRARSGYRHSDVFKSCDVTVVDIVADDSVDVVADIHGMSRTLGSARFDFAICVSVFEHLMMPWKAVLEINKVLRDDALIYIQTHQTVGMHDLPWDYYRFSDESWKGLLNPKTGFKIEATLMTGYQRIVPAHYYIAFEGFENSGGFNESAVIARKTNLATLDWPVDLHEVVGGNYPV